MNELQTPPMIKNNGRNIAIIIGILALLSVAYYVGTRSHGSSEVITPTVQSTKTGGAVPASSLPASQVSGGVYDYSEAGNHIGENATIRGTVIDVYTSKTGTIFFDFCKSYKTCPFSAVIFASKASDFPNVKQYGGQALTITGPITSYQGKAEIVIESPSQIGK